MTREEQLLKRLREATLTLRAALDERDALVRERSEPIAIVGMGCRFPGGADDPAAYWQLLAEGRDAVRALDERWARVGAQPREAAPRWAGLLTGAVDEFDAGFFGVAPREAAMMDPQQRLLLEVGWEALEDAGVPPHTLLASRTGVFIGATNTDYRDLLARLPRAEQDAYTVTGNLLSVAAGRLAYTWGLQGPCLTVDTVCSSSLVVVHLACQSLRQGECDLVLAGGVNLVLSPDTMDGMTRTQALSPGGRCRTFDALADGFARGEGCGLVVLKRLSDARRDGDRIWGLVRGSAVNQDGRGTGLTAPNVLAQEALLRAALRSARATAVDVGFIETHGTGTSLGDPIEVEALRAVLGEPRADGGRCVLGAVKTNIGHLEAAAGIAGLIKAVLVLHHGHVPRNLNLRAVNPRLALAGTALALATEAVAWPRGPRPRLAGVSAFGLSGTNAHVILEEAPAVAAVAATQPRAVEVVVLSARTAAGLVAQAAKLHAHVIAGPALGLAELAFSLATTRSPMEQRLAIAASSREDLLAALAKAARGEEVAVRGVARRGQLAVLFTGQGAQVAGMGRGLHAAWPVFSEAFDRCVALFELEMAAPLRAVMWAAPGSEQAARLDRTEFAQPALFALEYALLALWRSWGAEPGLLAGHSVGELVAACAAEVFSLEDAVRLVAARGRLMQALPAGGRMVAIAASEAEAAAAIVGVAARVAIAAVNGPDQVVISGAAAEVDAVAAEFAARGRRTRVLRVSHAFHSPSIEPMLAEFERIAATVRYRPATRAVVSNVTGALAGPEIATAAYWVRHARATVRFADGVQALHAAGATWFVELGPRSVLLAAVPGCLPGATPVLLAALRGGRDETVSACEALAGWWASGGSPRWAGVFPDGGRRVALPGYAWQRQRHWPEGLRAPESGAGVADFYDALTRTDALAGRRSEGVFAEKYLTFAPFVEVLPGFSWMIATATPMASADHVERVLQAQREMRAVLFRGVDFAGCRRVLDFGCGYATDLIALARRHPHLELHGYTISAEQARLGQQRARDAEVSPRVQVFHRDSARGEFAADYDAVFGVEVACHIRDKQALLANIGAHLRDGGALVLADFVSHASFDIDHEEASSFLATRERWIAALTGGGLQLLECVDVSPQIANFLHDPEFEANLEIVERGAGDPGVRAAFRSYDQLRELLRRGLASYVLMTCRREAGLTGAELGRHNRAAFAASVAYPAALAALRGDDGRTFAVAWQAAARPAARVVAGRWALIGDGGLAGPLAAALLADGHRVARLVGEVDAVGLRGRLQAAFAGQAPTAVVHLGGLDALPGEEVAAGAVEAALVAGCDVAVAAVQALVDAGWRDPPRLWLVTRGAQGVGDGAVEPAQALLLGLGRVAAIEHPELRCGRIDVDPARPGDAVAALTTELLGDDVEDEVAWRGGERRVARLIRRAPETGRGPAEVVRADGSYVITGGLGGLGLGVARWLTTHGAGHVVLVGRSGMTTADQRAAVAAMEAAGARVTVARVDVADREALAQVLAEVARTGPPLRGVVHAAGVADPGMLRTLTPARLRTVMAAKVLGACHLHALTEAAGLDFFVLYASISGLLGLAGTGNYAAANAFLDALALHRRARGLPGLSLDWGLFSAVGLAVRADGHDPARYAQGLRAMTPESGLAALGRLLAGPEAQVAVALFDPRQWVDAYPAAAASPRWSRLLQARPAEVGARGSLAQLAGLGPAAWAQQVGALVRAQVARVLGLDAADVPDDAPLTSLGMDSLMGLEVRNRLEVAFAIEAPSTLLWTYPTVAALCVYLREAVRGPATAPMQPPEDEVMSSDESERLIDAEFDALL